MPTSLIVSMAVSIAVVMIVLSMLAGGLAPAFSATTLGQAVLGLVSALVGIIGGQAIHARFLAR